MNNCTSNLTLFFLKQTPNTNTPLFTYMPSTIITSTFPLAAVSPLAEVNMLLRARLRAVLVVVLEGTTPAKYTVTPFLAPSMLSAM